MHAWQRHSAAYELGLFLARFYGMAQGVFDAWLATARGVFDALLAMARGVFDTLLVLCTWTRWQVSDWLHYTKERNYRICDSLTRKTRKLIKCITVIEVSACLTHLSARLSSRL
jgi:hypothetical protein